MKIYSNHLDEELLLLLSADSALVFDEIYNRYWDKLFNAAYKRIKNSETCKEIVQDVFTKFWQNRTSIQPEISLGSYLYSAVKYNVIDHYRKYTVRKQFVDFHKGADETDSATMDYIYLNDLKRKLEHFVNQLPPKCKIVYEMSRLEYKSNREIAAILKISEKTVEGHLTKALNSLKVQMQGGMTIIIFAALEYISSHK